MKNEKEMEEMFTLSQAEPSLMETALVPASGLPVSDVGNREPVFGLEAGRQHPAGQGRITPTC